MMKLPVLFVFLAVLGACSSRKEIRPIEVNRMKLIMWDLIKAGEWYNNIIAKDSTASKRKVDTRLFAQVFALHGVTGNQYYESYRYYEAHPIEFKTLVDSVDAYATREKTTLFERQNHGQAR
ncbi:MAG: DUF4296 domain-containing protein [Chitinophagaceae bacterium]|nr:DUF4296 domain-containing protein [Chitinophagaceae bacterium]